MLTTPASLLYALHTILRAINNRGALLFLNTQLAEDWAAQSEKWLSALSAIV